ncbi:hypothetical protein [Mycolicibacterium helvum]|nr:hypothetical protein [Mycolicibacterium helvum]
MTIAGHSKAVTFAGAVTIATLALCGAASSSTQFPLAGPDTVSGHVVAVDDDNGDSVNDQGQTSGDIFTQNAQDQSTA